MSARARDTVTFLSQGKRMSHDPTGDSTDPDEEVGDTGDVQQNLKGRRKLVV